MSLRLSRAFAIGESMKVEALVEVFNLTNRENIVTINGNFGAGAYPTSPSVTYGQITAVGDPRSAQFGLRFTF
jgi:hypothetical protein